MTTPPLRRATRAPINPAPTTPTPPQRNGQRVVNASTHQGRKTVTENTRTDALRMPALPADEERAEVRVSHGRTINIGDFNSVRIDVTVTLPCTVGTVQDVIALAHDHVVEAFIAEEEYLLGHAQPQPQRRGARRG